MPFPGLPKPGIKFLADLARHNDRDWFQPRKDGGAQWRSLQAHRWLSGREGRE
jgi:uncharacterized protein (DUF2461 family)